MTRDQILEGLDKLVLQLANDRWVPDGWSAHEWAYVKGIGSGAIFTLIERGAVMGSEPTIGYDQWPHQGAFLHRRTGVVFHYDTSRELTGTIIRNDIEEPFRTMIALDDGRVVLDTECQYSPMLASPPSTNASDPQAQPSGNLPTRASKSSSDSCSS